jgi:uncharacterized protein (DUF305 family)
MYPTHTRGRAALAVAGVLTAASLAALSLTGCGSSSPAASSASASPSSRPTSTAGDAHNAADVAFSQGMVPHHQQAVAMAELAASRASSPDVKSMAATIKSAQAPEITELTGWLSAWREPVPATMPSMSDMPSAAATSMPGTTGTMGMMSAAQMTALEQASGHAFDLMFLRMMIEHHRGAVQMASDELTNGQYAPAKRLARAIVATQSAQISEMTTLLKRG